MEVYAIPVLTETGKIKWIHAKDFNPDEDFCCCPQCRRAKLAQYQIVQEIPDVPKKLP